MKKKLLAGIAVAAIALTMALNVSFSAKSNNLSDLSLANVEALAAGAELNDPAWWVYMQYCTGCRCWFEYEDEIWKYVCEDVLHSVACYPGGDDRCDWMWQF